jgi:hypothetical protein
VAKKPVATSAKEEAKIWKPLYFEDVSRETQIATDDNALDVVFDAIGISGLYNINSFKGNFDVRVNLDYKGGAACGLLLLKEKDGLPDIDNYVGLKQSLDKNQKQVIEVIARKDGHDYVCKHKFWRSKFKYNLGNKTYGQKARALRIAKDEKANCLHFYYLYDREIDGKVVSGWMEFSTMPDFSEDPFYMYLFVEADGKNQAECSFTDPVISILPADDKSDKDTGFKATRRDYTFSGFSGDAVVVSFDKEFPFYDTAKFVFWNEANYIPWWHIDDKCTVSYEFCETWGGGTTGCCEPMSDKLRRWTQAEIVESNEARVVVHWHYVLADPHYRWWGRSNEEKPYADEYYTFYPDGTGVRKLVYTPSLNSGHAINWNEISELMVISRGGVKPGEYLKETALTLMDTKTKEVDFLWDLSKEEPIAKMPEEVQTWDEVICRVNLKMRPSVFEVFAHEENAAPKTFPYPLTEWWANYGAEWAFEMRGGYEFEDDFWTFSHWPISKIPYDEPVKTNGKFVREPSHTSLLPVAGHPGVTGVTTWAMLIGLVPEENKETLQKKARSWIYTPGIKMLDDSCSFVENDYYQRALVFNTASKDPVCNFIADPEANDSVLYNPVFIIKNWKPKTVSLSINGTPIVHSPSKFRYAVKGTKAIIWIKGEFKQKTEFLIKK